MVGELSARNSGFLFVLYIVLTRAWTTPIPLTYVHARDDGSLHIPPAIEC